MRPESSAHIRQDGMISGQCDVWIYLIALPLYPLAQSPHVNETPPSWWQGPETPPPIPHVSDGDDLDRMDRSPVSAWAFCSLWCRKNTKPHGQHGNPHIVKFPPDDDPMPYVDE